MEFYLIAIVTLLLVCTAAGAKGWFNWIWGALTGLVVGCVLTAALYVILGSPWFRKATGLQVPVSRIVTHAGIRLERAGRALNDLKNPRPPEKPDSGGDTASTVVAQQ